MGNQRILLKISGEALSGENHGEKYSENMFHLIAEHLKKLRSRKIDIGIVTGGGNLFRGRDLSGLPGVKRVTADSIGMLGTVQNSLVLRDYFESVGLPTSVSSAISMRGVCDEILPERIEEYFSEGKIIIFAAGLGRAYFSTDSNAVERALEIRADMLVMAKNGVDGIYTADPKTDKTAKKIDRIKTLDVIKRELKVADLSAMALALENKLAIKIIPMDHICDVFLEEIGSLIEP